MTGTQTLNIVAFHNLVSFKFTSNIKALITIFSYIEKFFPIVLSLILKQHPPKWLIERPDIKERIEALLPYTGKLNEEPVSFSTQPFAFSWPSYECRQ